MRKILPILISVFVIVLGMLSADASGNILHGVNVKTEPDSYTIELISDNPAHMTKRIVSANRVIVNLKDIEISDNLSTRFDGCSVTDSIMVDSGSRGEVNILVQGKNIAYSNIEFRRSVTPTLSKNSVFSLTTGLMSVFSGEKTVNNAFQYIALFILGIVLLCEIQFIRSKYKELEKEKQSMNKNIAETSGFKDFMPGYGAMGLKKPYTTPIYTNPLIYRLKNFNTSEATTLNMLSKRKPVKNIISNPTGYTSFAPVKQKINIETDNISTSVQNVSDPIENSKLKLSIKQLEQTTKLYLDEFLVH